MWMIRDYYQKIIEILLPSYCYLCKEEGKALCSSCRDSFSRAVETPSPFIRSHYSFKDTRVKHIIHAIKYFHRKDLIAPLLEPCLEELTKRYQGYDYIVPIPMPKLRRYMRGYNHAETLAHLLSNHLQIPLTKELLFRNQNKKRQATIRSRRERLLNQQKAFTASPLALGKKILVVDDVTTTGATLFAAEKSLHEQGALSVEAFTLAH